MNYTVFDVETANNQRDSICSIGIIRCENDAIIYENEILINPETDFNYFNTRINGISAADVANAPIFPEVWAEIRPYFENTILVAHSAKPMDLCALYRTLERYHLPIIENDYICTYELAKKAFRNDNSVQSYNLDVIARLFRVDLLHHHDALDDTRACYGILNKFMELYPDLVVAQPYNYKGNSGNCGCNSDQSRGFYSDNTKEMQKLQMVVIDIIEDGIITADEIKQLQEWLKQHECLKGFYPFDKIFEIVEVIMLDGVMDEDEERELLLILDSFINPQTENVVIDFVGKTVCLSGDFIHGGKKQVEDLFLQKGSTVVSSVTSKVDVLVLGEAGSAAWKYGNYGSKYEKAQQLIEKGHHIKVVKEKDVIN